MIYWRMGVFVSGLLLLGVACPPESRAREITVTVRGPAFTARLQVKQVWEVDGEIWVVSIAEGHGGRIGAGPPPILTLSATVEVEADADVVVKHFYAVCLAGCVPFPPRMPDSQWEGFGATGIDSPEAFKAQMEEDGIEIDEVLYESDAPDN